MFLPGQFIKKQPVSEDPSKRPRLVAYKTTVDADLKLSQLSKEVSSIVSVDMIKLTCNVLYRYALKTTG